jgi:hypothetical protein
VTWPVALDNDYKTWTAYSNEYWPAEYLIDKTGRVRHIHFGEGEYGATEKAIRSLLAEAGASVPRRTAAVADATPNEVVTPETYLGSLRIERYAGDPIKENRVARYTFPSHLPRNELSYAGEWRIGPERAVATGDARLRLHFVARNVYVVLGGRGRVEVSVAGRPAGSIRVDADRLYTVFSSPKVRDALLELRFFPGVNAYSFTFG